MGKGRASGEGRRKCTQLSGDFKCRSDHWQGTGARVAPALPLAAVATGAVTAGMAPADAAAHDAPSHQAPKEEDENANEEKGWIEIELVDEDDHPIAGERYRVILADGSTVAQGTTDDKGCARVSGIDRGTCKVTFPGRDKDAWKKF